jgi:predicted GTPase
LAHELIRDVYTRYPHIGPVLPNVGYSEDQRAALRQTIAASSAEVVVVATPIDPDEIVPPARPACAPITGMPTWMSPG